MKNNAGHIYQYPRNIFSFKMHIGTIHKNKKICNQRKQNNFIMTTHWDEYAGKEKTETTRS